MRQLGISRLFLVVLWRVSAPVVHRGIIHARLAVLWQKYLRAKGHDPGVLSFEDRLRGTNATKILYLRMIMFTPYFSNLQKVQVSLPRYLIQHQGVLYPVTAFNFLHRSGIYLAFETVILSDRNVWLILVLSDHRIVAEAYF